MSKAIFTTKVNPTYDDLPEVRYHFPKTYLNVARQAVGDWVLYYEPRRSDSGSSSRGGRQAYFATAFVREIVEDRARKDRYYALVSDYLEFPEAVPFKEGTHYWESGLRKSDGSTNKGFFGRAVRGIPDEEYELILRRGYVDAIGLTEESEEDLGRYGSGSEPSADYGREIVSRVVNQRVRDAAFARIVRQAYDSTCAMTGIQVINGGGRAEIEAAHIRPVADHGPDSPRNGLALSRTCHWMFDRGILSLEDDGKILTAGSLVSEPVQRMLNPEGYLSMPEHEAWRPHRQFLEWHREHVFKG
ncbi:MAG: HNH endonuclease [Deltaproteobacteria bacterium]|nr:HNH endonuclease [Deltaproteobacteria bacterium]